MIQSAGFVAMVGTVGSLVAVGNGQWSVVIGAAFVAAVMDVRYRRIPNWLTLPLAVCGLFLAGWHEGWSGLGAAVLGCVLLALPYLLLFVLGCGGAGDAKMMGAVGAWLGVEAGIMVLVAVTLAGGVLALWKIAADSQRRRYLSDLAAMLYVGMIGVCQGPLEFAALQRRPQAQMKQPDRRLTMSYGPAIFFGLCCGAVAANVWRG